MGREHVQYRLAQDVSDIGRQGDEKGVDRGQTILGPPEDLGAAATMKKGNSASSVR
jgi:hypothetical protein